MASGASGGACLESVGGKSFHCIQVGGQSESALSDRESISEKQNLALGRVAVFQCSSVTSQCLLNLSVVLAGSFSASNGLRIEAHWQRLLEPLRLTTLLVAFSAFDVSPLHSCYYIRTEMIVCNA